MAKRRGTRDRATGERALDQCREGAVLATGSGGSLPVRVLLVDDRPEFVAAAIAFFRDLREADLVGVAPCKDIAERYVARLSPDLVLLSLSLPDASGLEAVEQLGGRRRVPVIVLALDEAEAYRTAALHAGAIDFIPMGDFVARLPRVIRTLSRPPRGGNSPDSPGGQADGQHGETAGTPARPAADHVGGSRVKTGEIS